VEIAKAYLLGVHPVTESWGAGPPGQAATNRDLSVYFSPGVIWGAFALADLTGTLPAFWRDRLEHFYIQVSTTGIGPYTTKFSIAEVRPEALDPLVRLKPDLPGRMNELYSASLSRTLQPKRMGAHAHPCILFCQPAARELSRPAQDLAADAVGLMGFDECAVQPAQVANALFAAGPYGLWEYECAGAVALQDLSSGNHIGIPRVVYDLLRFQSLIFVLEDLRERLAPVPFVGRTVAQYLSLLATARRKAHP
jgi:hypothetical protein